RRREHRPPEDVEKGRPQDYADEDFSEHRWLMNASSQRSGQFGRCDNQREQQQNLQRVCQGRPPLRLSSNTERTWARGLDPAPTLLLRRCWRIVACSPDVSSHNIAPPHPWTGFNAACATGAAAGVITACANAGEPVGNNTKSGYASAPI